jgi:HEAT repeat protein
MVYIKALAQSGNQRSDAIEALIKLGDAGVDALATALEDSDSDIRVDACDALGLMGSTRALEPLV